MSDISSSSQPSRSFVCDLNQTITDPNSPFYQENRDVPSLADKILSLLLLEPTVEKAAYRMLLALRDGIRLAERDGKHIPANVIGPYLKAYNCLLNSCARSRSNVDVFSSHHLSNILNVLYLEGNDIQATNRNLFDTVLHNKNERQRASSFEYVLHAHALHDPATANRFYSLLCEIPEEGKSVLISLLLVAQDRVSDAAS